MAEELKACRYRVEKTGYGFWPYCVRAGDGTRELFRGHKKQCMVVAAELETAFEDGKFVADRAQLPSQGGEAVAVIASHTGDIRWLTATPPCDVGDKLYTHPADQVAEPGTKSVPVELLVLIEQSWRVPNGLPKSVPEHVEQKITAGLSQLRALLATPSPK